MKKLIGVSLIWIFAGISIALPISVLSHEAKEKSKKHSHGSEEDGHDHDESESSKSGEDAHKHDEEAGHSHGEGDEHTGEKDDHGHAHDEKKSGDGHAHGDGEEDEHGHGEGGNSSVGPDKGIVEANETDGFKLSPEAFKNFGVKTVSAAPGVMLTLPKRAIFFGLQERNLFRLRNGFFKRIDFTTVSKTKTEFSVRASDLKAGDQIVVDGVGFLRIAELAATGGVADGHSH